jgi:pyruvate-ferredoxin/flavodoxin oxidoreductase
MAIGYGSVYVAQVAMGASDSQTLEVFREAEAYDGPSIIIAYAHCIAHGIDMTKGLQQQKLAVEAGHWLLYRYDPRRAEQGSNPLRLDSKEPKLPLREYVAGEGRYRMLEQIDPAAATRLLGEAQEHAREQYRKYAAMAQ